MLLHHKTAHELKRMLLFFESQEFGFELRGNRSACVRVLVCVYEREREREREREEEEEIDT